MNIAPPQLNYEHCANPWLTGTGLTKYSNTNLVFQKDAFLILVVINNKYSLALTTKPVTVFSEFVNHIFGP